MFKQYNFENIYSKETQSLSQSFLHTRMALINIWLLYNCSRDDALLFWSKWNTFSVMNVPFEWIHVFIASVYYYSLYPLIFLKMSQLCFICNKLLTEAETVTVSRGMKTLIDASIERGDEFVDYLRSEKSVTVRVDCRKSYTRKTSIAAIKRQYEDGQASTSKVCPLRTRARVSESDFCFKKCCLFCGDEEDEKALAKRKFLLMFKWIQLISM